MFSRLFWLNRISEAWQRRSIVLLTGVRGVGKTYLARSIAEGADGARASGVGTGSAGAGGVGAFGADAIGAGAAGLGAFGANARRAGANAAGAGVGARAGSTASAEYFDCGQPATRALAADAEGFLRSMRGRTVVLDQIERLGNFAELLEVAASRFPDVRILATGTLGPGATMPRGPSGQGGRGGSTQGAWSAGSAWSTGAAVGGRRADVWLTPMTMFDLAEFGSADVPRRMLRGGLPEFFLGPPAGGPSSPDRVVGVARVVGAAGTGGAAGAALGLGAVGGAAGTGVGAVRPVGPSRAAGPSANTGVLGSPWVTGVAIGAAGVAGGAGDRWAAGDAGVLGGMVGAAVGSAGVAGGAGAAVEEWVDAFWARDVQEPFRLERGAAFRRLFGLLMAQSGGMFEAARLAKPCGASRTTISTYLAVLEAAGAMHVVPPYAAGGRAEIVSAPKVYGFDTGFVCHYRGATTLRPDDLDPLWEHLVLNELHAHVGRGPIRYWRTKHGSEVDFVLVRHGRPPVAVECRWSADSFAPAALRSFRGAYPGGPAFVVTADTPDGRPYDREYGTLRVTFVSVRDLIRMWQGN